MNTDTKDEFLNLTEQCRQKILELSEKLPNKKIDELHFALIMEVVFKIMSGQKLTKHDYMDVFQSTEEEFEEVFYEFKGNVGEFEEALKYLSKPPLNMKVKHMLYLKALMVMLEFHTKLSSLEFGDLLIDSKK